MHGACLECDRCQALLRGYRLGDIPEAAHHHGWTMKRPGPRSTSSKKIDLCPNCAAAAVKRVHEDGSLRHVLAKDSPAVTISHSLHVGFMLPDDREYLSWPPGGATAFGLALITADADAIERKAREDAEYERRGPMDWEDDERAQDWRRRNETEAER